MTLPLSLEPLEDRTMPSGFGLSILARLDSAAGRVLFRLAAAENQNPVRPGPKVLAGIQTMTASMIESRVEAVQERWRPVVVAIVEDAVRLSEEVSEAYAPNLREALPFPNVGKLVTEEKESDGTSAGMRAGFVWESPGANTGRVPPGTLTWGQLVRSPGVALPEAPLALDLIALAEGTGEMPPPGPFADTVILDAWQGGLPLPQTEVVPAAEKDLTIIAAYLVGTPPARPPADAAPPSAPDPGLTDFIVGRQESPPEPPGLPPPECVAVAPTRPPEEQQRPLVSDRATPASSARDERRVDPDACIIPPVERGERPGDEPQDGEPDEE